MHVAIGLFVDLILKVMLYGFFTTAHLHFDVGLLLLA